MTHFEDLSPYEYWKKTWPQVAPEHAEAMLNVGWLDPGVPYPKGRSAAEILAALREKALEPVRLMRGVHHCGFCDSRSPLPFRSEISGRQGWLGNGELEVTAADGTIFVAPTLVVHYVGEHDYLPPQSFLDALG
ncbi:hypothetical protein AB0M02_32035 [Actinoplanes sp. NPDC051861]|uniref:DUF7919 family protein n=1 Tax=Actinoplanes sp. NPDC051861 TaxID=3155170 RepID=UPI0034318ABD